jgi:glycosyltransferase involved in cell wall biosynthesis
VVQTTECNFPELTAAGGAWQCAPEASALEDSLRQALSAEDIERIDRGARGRQLVETGYTWDQLAARVEEICRSSSNVTR